MPGVVQGLLHKMKWSNKPETTSLYCVTYQAPPNKTCTLFLEGGMIGGKKKRFFSEPTLSTLTGKTQTAAVKGEQKLWLVC